MCVVQEKIHKVASKINHSTTKYNSILNQNILFCVYYMKSNIFIPTALEQKNTIFPEEFEIEDSFHSIQCVLPVLSILPVVLD